MNDVSLLARQQLSMDHPSPCFMNVPIWHYTMPRCLPGSACIPCQQNVAGSTILVPEASKPGILRPTEKVHLDCSNCCELMHLIEVLLHTGGLQWHDILIRRPELKGL